MQEKEEGRLFTQLTLSVFKLSGLLSSEGDEITNEFGLTSSRWKILGATHLSESAVTVPQIARTMGQSRQAVQRLVDVMTKDGLLTLEDNPNHKRAKYVKLTQKGEETYHQLYEKHIPWAQMCADGLSLNELKTALEVINKTVEKLAKG